MTILAHKVEFKDGKINGRCVIMHHSNYGDETLNLSQVGFRSGYEDLLGNVLAVLVETGQSHNKHTAVVQSGLWGSFPDDSPFNKYNISLETKLGFYEKEI